MGDSTYKYLLRFIAISFAALLKENRECMDFKVYLRICFGKGQLAIIYSDSAEEIRFSTCPGVYFLTCHVSANTSPHRSESMDFSNSTTERFSLTAPCIQAVIARGFVMTMIVLIIHFSASLVKHAPADTRQSGKKGLSRTSKSFARSSNVLFAAHYGDAL